MHLPRAVLCVVLLSGCQATDDLKPAELQAELNHGNPIIISGNPMPSVNAGLSEKLTITAVPAVNPLGCKDCSFTNGLDPEMAPIPHTSFLDNGVIPPSLRGGHTGLPKALDPILFQAQTRLFQDPSSDNVNSMLKTIKAAFSIIPGAGVELTEAVPTPWVRAFKPIYGRHRVSSFGIGGTALYPPFPRLFNELTDRGARTWCAVRQAAKKAGSKSNLTMLDQSLVNIFDIWKVGLTRSTVTFTPLDMQTKSLNEQDAQAFMIPFALGSQVAPLSGPLMPEFGEFMHPLVWLTGDAEVRSNEATSQISSNNYRNIQHFDAIGGVQYSGGHVGFHDLMLMNLGLFQLYLHGAVDVTIGALDVADPGAQGKVLFQKANVTSGGLCDDGAINHVLLDPMDGGLWPSPRTSLFAPQVGELTTDLPLGLAPSCGPEIGGYYPFSQYAAGGCNLQAYQGSWPCTSTPTPAWNIPIGNGTAARWRNDDDRAFAIKDEVSLNVGIDGSGGIDFGVIAINILASLDVTVASRVRTIFREELSATDKSLLKPAGLANTPQQVAQSNIVVTPIGENELTIVPLSIFLRFKLWLPIIGDLTWKPRILKLPDVGTESSIGAPEPDRVRIGEYSEVPVGTGLALSSHLPELGFGDGNEFASMPQSVSQCLYNDNSVYGTTPNPKPTVDPSTDPLPYGLCFYGPSVKGLEWIQAVDNDVVVNGELVNPVFTTVPLGSYPLPDKICEDRLSWPVHFADPDQESCVNFTLSYLCGKENDTTDVSKYTTYNGEPRVAHLVQKGVGEEELAGKMWVECLKAFDKIPVEWLANPVGQIFLHNYVDVHVCNPKTLEAVGLLEEEDEKGCEVDPYTHQCWSFTPCYIDPKTGTCSEDCIPGATIPNCEPAPPVRFCDPSTGSCLGPPAPPPPTCRDCVPAPTPVPTDKDLPSTRG